MTDSASHPNAFVPVIVNLAEPQSMADDRVVLANRTPPRQEGQWDHPGSMLSFVSGSAIKRITAGVKARRDRSLLSFDLLAGPSPSGKVSFERKKNTAFRWATRPLTQNIGRYKRTFQAVARRSRPALRESKGMSQGDQAIVPLIQQPQTRPRLGMLVELCLPIEEYGQSWWLWPGDGCKDKKPPITADVVGSGCHREQSLWAPDFQRSSS